MINSRGNEVEMFTDKVFLITGAGSGIGRETAVAFSRRNAKVVVADISRQEGETTSGIIRGEGGEVRFYRVDVTNASEVEGLIQEIVRGYGRLDGAFNCAGTEGILSATADCPEEDWNRVIQLNLKGVWLCMKYEIRHMRKQKKGVIVNASSIAGLKGAPNFPAYAASKHAVVGLTKTAALEYANVGLRINAVCPGLTDTPMSERIISEAPDVVNAYPMGRIAAPNEVAGAVIWLCSEDASFVTGHMLVVDGGRTAG
jgi:NAD(P)-dependent dehydrogenase (short-subunit alcohol dehydrogenase family)